MNNPTRGPLARWLYEGGPSRLLERASSTWRTRPRLEPGAWRRVAVVAVVASSAGAAAVLWPKPLEHGLSEQAVRECVIAVTEIPTEYAARLGYKLCLETKRAQATAKRGIEP